MNVEIGWDTSIRTYTNTQTILVATYFSSIVFDFDRMLYQFRYFTQYILRSMYPFIKCWKFY